MKMFVNGELPDLQNPAHCLFTFKCQFLDICSRGTTEGLILRDKIHPELDTDEEPSSEILERYGLEPPKKMTAI